MRIHNHTFNRRAVTLTELLVVLVIISLLATIAVPVYINKAQQARIAIAKQDMREIAHAEEQCGVIHGFYIPFQMLDDLQYQDTNTRADDDNLNNENDLFLIHVSTDVRDQIGQQLHLLSNDPKVSDLRNKWAGPFLNPHRVAFAEEIKRSERGVNNTLVQLDFPLDPWGNPYRFYSPIGIIGTTAQNEIRLPNKDNLGSWQSFSDGRLVSASGTEDPFDRFAVVSFGPNLLGRTTDEQKDDIYYLFGGVFTESSFRAFY